MSPSQDSNALQVQSHYRGSRSPEQDQEAFCLQLEGLRRFERDQLLLDLQLHPRADRKNVNEWSGHLNLMQL